jgi:hypothetical protein
MHYDVRILYVGHESGTRLRSTGGSREELRATYRRDGRVLAVATIGCDLESLRAEFELERRLLPKDQRVKAMR